MIYLVEIHVPCCDLERWEPVAAYSSMVAAKRWVDDEHTRAAAAFPWRWQEGPQLTKTGRAAVRIRAVEVLAG